MIELTAYWALFPGDDIIPEGIRMSSAYFTTQLAVVPAPVKQPSRLHYNQALAGIFQAGITIAANNLFYKGLVLMRDGDEPVGYLDYDVKDDGLNDVRELSQHAEAPAPLTANQGTIVDPVHPELKVNYKFTGVKFLARDIFTAFLDSLANIAPYDRDALCTQSAGISTSHHCSIFVRNEGEAGNERLTWARLSDALIIIWEQLMSGQPTRRRPRFEGLEFNIDYAGQRIGEGSIINMASPTAIALS